MKPKKAEDERAARRVWRWIEHNVRGRSALFEPRGFEHVQKLARVEWAAPFTTAQVHESLGGPRVYAEIVRSVHYFSGRPRCFVFYLTEPDNIVTEVKFVRPYRGPQAHARDLRYFEQQPAAEGGSSYLGLVPFDLDWLLLSDYDQADRLQILLLGPRSLCTKGLEALEQAQHNQTLQADRAARGG